MAEGVEAGVLVEEDGIGAADHEVFVGGVGEGVPVVAAVADKALVELGDGVAVHGEAGLDAGDEEGGVVEAVAGCQDELFLRGYGGELGVCGDGAEVGHDAEDALGLLGDAVGVGSWLASARLVSPGRFEMWTGSVYRESLEAGVKAGSSWRQRVAARERWEVKTDSRRIRWRQRGQRCDLTIVSESQRA